MYLHSHIVVALILRRHSLFIYPFRPALVFPFANAIQALLCDANTVARQHCCIFRHQQQQQEQQITNDNNNIMQWKWLKYKWKTYSQWKLFPAANPMRFLLLLLSLCVLCFVCHLVNNRFFNFYSALVDFINRSGPVFFLFKRKHIGNMLNIETCNTIEFPPKSIHLSELT